MPRVTIQTMPTGEQGSVLMEFTLVFPIWLLLVLAVMQCSMILSARLVLHYAAFTAARAAVTANDSSNDTDMYNSAIGAARQVCALVLQEESAANRRQIPGWGTLPGSGSVEQLVNIPKSETVTVITRRAVVTRVRYIHRTRTITTTTTTTRAIPIYDRDRALVKIHLDMEYPLVFPLVKAMFGHRLGQTADNAWNPFVSGGPWGNDHTPGPSGQPPAATGMYTISMATDVAMARPFSYKN